MRHFVLSALLLLVISVPALTQGCDYTRHLSDVDTSHVSRDPEAVKALRRSLNALGGAQAWAGVQTIRITASTEATQHNPATEFTSIEDFSRDDRPRASRTLTSEGKTRKQIADEEREPVVAKIREQSLPVPPTSALELIATDALVGLRFNAGPGAVTPPVTLLNRTGFANQASFTAHYITASGVSMQGLFDRRTAEWNTFSKGIYVYHK